jgi:1,2-diacylglycerol 3-alpha-glucosyltransferase
MTRRLVVITEIISPYRIPLFNALAQSGSVDPHVIFLAETDPGLRQWQIYREEIRFSYQVLPSWRKRLGSYNVLFNTGIASALEAERPEVILCGGYNYPASWQALYWARARGTPFVLWSESNLQDQRGGHAAVEFLKKKFWHSCRAFVVPGHSALEYLLAKGIQRELVYTAVNAVDNSLFAQAGALARQQADRIRGELQLPNRYFLFAGRLVPEKGVFELLSAYAKLQEPLRNDVGLVFAGDGPSREKLELQAASIAPGTIRFTGFASREQLAVYYALAEMLILPTYTDTWGLVVNEAMACGLPVIVSRAAGCAVDLVKENWNGQIVEPRDITSLTLAMDALASQPGLCATMGENSRQRIASFSPGEWSRGITQMVEGVRGNCD